MTTVESVSAALTAAGLVQGELDYEASEQVSGGFVAGRAPHGVGVAVLFPNAEERQLASKVLEAEHDCRAGYMEKSGPPYRLWVWQPGEGGGSANPDEEV